MRRGFTLAEFLILAVIVGLLVTILVPVFSQAAKSRAQAEALVTQQLERLKETSSRIEEVKSMDAEIVKEQVLIELERQRLKMISELPEDVRNNFMSAE
jgi:Tfp pilus assembly protein PilE